LFPQLSPLLRLLYFAVIVELQPVSFRDFFDFCEIRLVRIGNNFEQSFKITSYLSVSNSCHHIAPSLYNTDEKRKPRKTRDFCDILQAALQLNATVIARVTAACLN